MEKISTFIIMVLATLVTVALLALSFIGFREEVPTGEVYLGGVFVGALLILLWIGTIYLWKD